VISVENRKVFPPPCILHPAEGVPLGTGYRRMKSKTMELSGRERSLMISSAVWIQFTNVTDGHRGTAKMMLTHASLSCGENVT